MGRRERAKVWQYQRGEPPNTVTAIERIDRGRVIEVRWWVPRLKRFQRRSLGFSIRDANGVVVDDLQRQAVQQAQTIYDSLMAGRSPFPEESAANAGPLALREGFSLATTVPTGMYVVESEHLRELRRAARDILEAIAYGQKGEPRTWDALSYAVVRELWVNLARRYKATGKGGPAWTERCVVALLQVSQWLASEEKTLRPLTAKKTWREQFRREWEQLTSSRITRSTPRHNEEEIRRIFAALDDPRVDPRIALALELGAEARLGQVRRLMRADVDLSRVGAFELGRIVVHGVGKKLGVVRDLTPEERGAIDSALSGYLRDLESAYLAGLRANYPMFPSGRLRYDVAPSRVSRRSAVSPVRRAKQSVGDTPIGKRALTDLFHELERVAKVEPIEGRAWYGIRRRATDLYEDYEKDERVLNDQTGHKRSDTRREVYQERDRAAIRAKSAETRRRVRSAAFGRALRPGPETGSDPDDE